MRRTMHGPCAGSHERHLGLGIVPNRLAPYHCRCATAIGRKIAPTHKGACHLRRRTWRLLVGELCERRDHRTRRSHKRRVSHSPDVRNDRVAHGRGLRYSQGSRNGRDDRGATGRGGQWGCRGPMELTRKEQIVADVTRAACLVGSARAIRRTSRVRGARSQDGPRAVRACIVGELAREHIECVHACMAVQRCVRACVRAGLHARGRAHPLMPTRRKRMRRACVRTRSSLRHCASPPGGNDRRTAREC